MPLASEIISEALALLGPNGERWCKRALERDNKDGTRSYCLLGAIDKVSIGKGYDSRAFTMCNMVIRQVPGYEKVTGVVKFNNDDATDFPALKGVMCTAIKMALEDEEGHSPTINNQEQTDEQAAARQ